MTLDKFFNKQPLGKENIYQILVVPNITKQRELSKDSYVLVMSNVIKELNKKRKDLFFHMPMPSHCKEFDFPNVKQYIFNTPTFPNSMRSHYDFYFWKTILDNRIMEIDLVFSHLPEQTTNVMNNMINLYSQDSPVIGYSHWIENKENNPNMLVSFYHNNISGMLLMKACGFNTQTQIDDTLAEAEQHYSKQTIDKLRGIMRPVYLGFEDDKIRKDVEEISGPYIVFNHRTHNYRGWEKFLQIIKKLRSKRTDFRLWLTMADATTSKTKLKKYFDDLSFIKFGGPADRQEYLDELHKCVAGFHGGNRWAMSSQDGLGQGVPYVYQIGSETKELFGDLETGFNTVDEAVEHFEHLITSTKWRNEQAKLALKHCRKVHSWKNRVKGFENMIDEGLSVIKKYIMGESRSREKLLKFIKDNKQVTISQIRDYMGWGKSIGFRKYRNLIRSLPHYYTTMIDKKEHYIYNK